jgi:L-ascorbate metabolism protein UlaG (beta-lactamase superfamily)
MKPEHFSHVAQDITSSQLPPNTIALWWLGQASIALKSADTTIYIDPFLSEYPGRLIPPPFAPAQAPPAHYVLITHEHVDHFDPKTLPGLAEASPQARFVVPLPVVEQVRALGIAPERVIGVQADEELDWGTIKLFPVPALHGLSSPPAIYGFDFVVQENQPLYRYLGYIVEMAGVRLYHGGDTIIYDGMVERLRKLNIDIACLPINGRNFFREQQNIVGNLDEREAADLAAAAGVKLLMPIHYDMFAGNRGRPGVLVDYVREYYPNLSCIVPAHGQRFTYLREDGD